jgi:hypothetical protein
MIRWWHGPSAIAVPHIPRANGMARQVIGLHIVVFGKEYHVPSNVAVGPQPVMTRIPVRRAVSRQWIAHKRDHDGSVAAVLAVVVVTVVVIVVVVVVVVHLCLPVWNGFVVGAAVYGGTGAAIVPSTVAGWVRVRCALVLQA